MSSGISFTDYASAREYQQNLAAEGINSNLSHNGGKYMVTQKEKTYISMRTAPAEGAILKGGLK